MSKIKIYCHIHTYPTGICSGADHMLARINEQLVLLGAEIIVGIDDCLKDYDYKGCKVTSNNRLIAERYEWADIIITHLVCNNPAVALADRFSKPLIHIVHNAQPTGVPPNKDSHYVVYNSDYVVGVLDYPNKSIIVQPPTMPVSKVTDHYDAEFITLVNLNQSKGGEMLYQLALDMPQYRFLGVLGAYGTQIQKQSPYRNISYRAYTNDMHEVYDQTKILIVPSKTESWSLCAAEAQANGIPVLCNDLPGLHENVGDAAIYCDSKRAYMDGIFKLINDRSYYNETSSKCVDRSNEKQHVQQLEKMFNFMHKIISSDPIDSDEALPEKVRLIPVKEKAEMPLANEKKVINNPSTQRKRKSDNRPK